MVAGLVDPLGNTLFGTLGHFLATFDHILATFGSGNPRSSFFLFYFFSYKVAGLVGPVEKKFLALLAIFWSLLTTFWLLLD